MAPRHRKGHRFGSGGEIEVDRNAACHRNTDVGERTGHRGGQENADHLFVATAMPCPTRQQQAAGERTAVGEFAASGISHGKSRPVPARGADEALRQRCRGSAGLCAEFLDRLPHLPGRGGRGHRLAERNRDRIRDAPRQFPEKAPTLEAEDAAPHALQMHGDHRNIEALDNFFHAPFKGQQVTGAADGPFGEDADDVALLQFLARLAQRGRRGAAYRDGAHQAKEPAQSFRFVVGTPHHESHAARERGSDQQAVDMRDVIGHQ
jgi:hypothetical protein